MSHLLPRFRTAESQRVVKFSGQPREQGICKTGKYGYASEADALEALVRVRRDRTTQAAPPESRVYLCRDCDLWHLTSQDGLYFTDIAPLHQGKLEPVDMYARRLERRIKEQRAQILSLHAIGQGTANNRHTRKRIATLTASLARVTELWQEEVANRNALVVEVERLRAKRRWWQR